MPKPFGPCSGIRPYGPCRHPEPATRVSPENRFDFNQSQVEERNGNRRLHRLYADAGRFSRCGRPASAAPMPPPRGWRPRPRRPGDPRHPRGKGMPRGSCPAARGLPAAAGGRCREGRATGSGSFPRTTSAPRSYPRLSSEEAPNPAGPLPDGSSPSRGPTWKWGL
jgi:hypothetical protein